MPLIKKQDIVEYYYIKTVPNSKNIVDLNRNWVYIRSYNLI